MPFATTPFPGLLVFEPQVWEDERGYFYESFNRSVFEAAGITCEFVQDNQAMSSYGVLRGLHYQVGAYAQAKLVRVLSGEVLDIVVDLREDSPMLGQWYGIQLSAANKKQLFVPRGFAHGYVVLSEKAEFFYKCDNFYAREHEGGLRYDDPKLSIDWEIAPTALTVADKDLNWPAWGSHRKP